LNAIKERLQVDAVDATRAHVEYPSGDDAKGEDIYAGNSFHFVVENNRFQSRARGGNLKQT